MAELDRNEVAINRDLVDEIVFDEDLRRIRACIQCGECSAVCPSGNWSPLQSQRIIRKCLIGASSVLSDVDIWGCTTCFNCYERCPRSIPVTEIILKIRNMACREGYILEPMKLVIKNLVETGHAVPIGEGNSKWISLREYFHLTALPPTVHSDKEGFKEISKILYAIRFNNRIPYR